MGVPVLLNYEAPARPLRTILFLLPRSIPLE